MNYSIKKTKIENVVTHLIKVGHISPREAMITYNVWRLAAIIFDLKKADIQIDTQDEPHQGGIHKRYYLIEKLQAEHYLDGINRRTKRRTKNNLKQEIKQKVSLSSSNYPTTDNLTKR
tara:strand:- start:12212 stop:12565 length:354 start_codon:yes stop_codon:yes gene_type:complete